jgi:hypothetical protein
MPIDRFALEDFERFLEGQKPYESLGLVGSEYCYRLILDGQSAIMLRSSIGANGLAKESGKDSIRLWLVGNDDKPIGSKLDSWTTRVSGWQNRLFDKIFELVKRRINAGDCRECGKPFGIYKRKSDKKLFVKCFNCSKKLGRNINGNLNSEGWFSPASQMEAYNNDTARTKNRGQMACPKETNHKDSNLLPSALRQENQINIPKSVVSETRKNSRNLQKLPAKTVLDQFLENPFQDDPEREKPKFKPSKYQEAIYDFVKNGNGHGVVEGVAGCGKTTTNVEALKLVPRTAKIKYAAFNKHIEKDISAKAPSYVSVSTFHSWGLGNIKKAYPKIKINQWKVHNLIDDKSPQIEREFKNESQYNASS